MRMEAAYERSRQTQVNAFQQEARGIFRTLPSAFPIASILGSRVVCFGTSSAGAHRTMSSTFNPSPDVPAEVENAAKAGELVVFVGAGISRLIGCPDWDTLA